MSLVKIVIPDQEVLRQRLLSFSNDQHMIKGLFSKIEESCGRELLPDEVIMLIDLAIYNYAQPPNPLYSFLNVRFEKLIEALIVDEDARNETINLYQSM